MHAGGVFEDMSTGSGHREGVLSLRQCERKLSMTRLKSKQVILTGSTVGVGNNIVKLYANTLHI